MIVRNEAGHLTRALASVKGLADRIVVVDTGSTDNTVAIAKNAGAEVFSFAWIDDFAAARNFSLDHASGDWVLILDADEEVVPQSHAEIRQCMTVEDALAFFVLRRDLTDASRLDSGTEMWHLRLYRRRDDLRYTGLDHPEFQPTIDVRAASLGLKVYRSTIRLRHYGYIGSELKPKSDRAVRLLQAELKLRPGQIYYLIELGRTLLSRGDPAGHDHLGEATSLLCQFRHKASPPTPIVAGLLEYLLMPAASRPASPISWEEAEALAERWFPDSPPLLWHRAGVKFQSGDFTAAAGLLTRLSNLATNDSYDKTSSFDPRIIGPDLDLNLAACQVRLGNLDEAEQWLARIPATSAAAAGARQIQSAIDELRKAYPAT
jgi:hypothetical protein